MTGAYEGREGHGTQIVKTEHRMGPEMEPLGNINWAGGMWHKKTSICCRNRERTGREEWLSNKGVANAAHWSAVEKLNVLEGLHHAQVSTAASEGGTVELYLPLKVS